MNTVVDVCKRAAEAFAADGSSFVPASTLRTQLEPLLDKTDGELRFRLHYVCLLIKDVMENLSGDVNYNAFGIALDRQRRTVREAIRRALEAIVEDAQREGDFHSSDHRCSELAGVYLQAISSLNKKSELLGEVAP
jgi:hypothetical protein